MTSAGNGAGDPGEARLASYLEELHEEPPRTDAAIVRRVERSVRWQRVVRDPLLIAAHLAGAVVDGISVFLGGGRRSDR